MWMDQQVSFYECAADNVGQPATFRQILRSRFAVEHNYYYKKQKWVNGTTNDLNTIITLCEGKLEKSQHVELKQTMQCYTPAALLKSKKQGAIEEISRTGILQLDFDYNDIKDYDVEDLKQC